MKWRNSSHFDSRYCSAMVSYACSPVIALSPTFGGRVCNDTTNASSPPARGGAHGAPRRAIIGAGCSNVSIVNLQGGVVTRGVSFDVPRLKGGAVP